MADFLRRLFYSCTSLKFKELLEGQTRGGKEAPEIQTSGGLRSGSFAARLTSSLADGRKNSMESCAVTTFCQNSSFDGTVQQTLCEFPQIGGSFAHCAIAIDHAFSTDRMIFPRAA